LKLGKTSWLILSIGIFIVVIAGLGLTRSQQLQEQGQLDDDLSIAQMRLDKLQAKELQEQQEVLQSQLDASAAGLVATQDSLRQIIESIDVTDEFFAIARSCNVTITKMTSSSINSEALEGLTCSMIQLTTVVEGEVSDLISYIIKLNTDFTMGAVQAARISIPDPCEEDKEPSANIQMVTYSYEGD